MVLLPEKIEVDLLCQAEELLFNLSAPFYITILFLLSGLKYFMASSLRRPLVLNTIVELYPRCN